MPRPLVAVPTYPRLEPGRVTGWADDGVGLPARYVDALRRAGAPEALFLPELDDDAVDDVLAPATYGEPATDTVYGVSPARDSAELALVRAAIIRELPTLAICRGHQVLAVALGAQLDQHITGRPGLLDHGVPGRENGSRLHDVQVVAGSKLADAIGTTATVSSHHHQAV